MKKIIALLLVAVMSLSIVACGGSNDSGSDNGNSNVSNKEYVTEEEFLSYFEIIELTAENYMDYLEFEEVEETDEFGETTGEKYLGIKLKDGYGSLSETVMRLSYKANTISYKKGHERPDNQYISNEEADITLYEGKDLGWIASTYSETDDRYQECEVLDINVTKVKGMIFKANVPEEIWKTSEDGEKYFRVGTKENSTKIVDAKDDPDFIWYDYATAITEVLEKQGKSAEATAYDIEYSGEETNVEYVILEAFDGKSAKIQDIAFVEYLEVFEITAENWKDYFEVVYVDDEDFPGYCLQAKNLGFCYELADNFNIDVKVINENAPLHGETFEDATLGITITDGNNKEEFEYTIDDFECISVQGKLIVANVPEELWETDDKGNTLVYVGSNSSEYTHKQGKTTQLKQYLDWYE